MNVPFKNTLRSIRDFLPNRVASWRRRRQLSTEREHYSRERVTDDLDKLPIPDGATVLVHSSLKSIGYVDGGPDAVVAALYDSVVKRRGGTLMLPTYSINGTMLNSLVEARDSGEVAFDALRTPSNLGAIPEAFRRLPGVERSVHPTHSFAAIGDRARELLATHHSCGSSFGAGTPMSNMLDHDSWLLGLGTNLGNVTLYHCLEDLESDFPFDVYTGDSFTVECKDGAGALHELTLRGQDGEVSRTRIDRPENAAIRDYFTKQFETNAAMTWHQVCEARCWLLSAPRLYAEAKRLMQAGITIYSTEEQISPTQDRCQRTQS